MSNLRPNLCNRVSDMAHNPFRWNRTNTLSYDSERKPFDKLTFMFHDLGIKPSVCPSDTDSASFVDDRRVSDIPHAPSPVRPRLEAYISSAKKQR